MFEKIVKALTCLFIVACMISFAVPVQAKVSMQEANQLKDNLTPTGAERAGNAEGTIPAWEGGMTSIPKNISYDPESDDMRPDPFADDKILFTITAQNMDQYADKLTPGLIGLFKRYPDTWKMNVYQTRRTFAQPQEMYDNIFKNATEAELIGDGSDGFTGAYGGTPFPIPKNGAELINNHIYRWFGGQVRIGSQSYTVYPNGSYDPKGAFYGYNRMDYFEGSRENFDEAGFGGLQQLAVFFDPPGMKGMLILTKYRTDFRTGGKGSWQYIPGIRRVRRAPDIAYDSPSSVFGGIAVSDDIYLYSGQTDRWDWKMNGKKEMFIPYNGYKLELSPIEEVAMPGHPNPAVLRWELHRVWECEATLKQGKRHCYGKRLIWQDEDSWFAVLGDNYDTRGDLWRTKIQSSKMIYDWTALGFGSQFVMDNQVPIWAISPHYYGFPRKRMPVPPEMLTTQYMRKLGKR